MLGKSEWELVLVQNYVRQETAGHIPKEGDKVYCRDRVSALSSG